jgi:hypothetical protein
VRIVIALVIVMLTLILSGFGPAPKDVLTYFNKMKLESVNYCRIYISKPGSTLSINKKLEKNDLESLVKLLNKSEGAKESKLPISKGGFTGLILCMNSGQNYTLFNTKGGFWLSYDNKNYEIVQSKYGKFLNTMVMKYTKE